MAGYSILNWRLLRRFHWFALFSTLPATQDTVFRVYGCRYQNRRSGRAAVSEFCPELTLAFVETFRTKTADNDCSDINGKQIKPLAAMVNPMYSAIIKEQRSTAKRGLNLY